MAKNARIFDTEGINIRKIWQKARKASGYKSNVEVGEILGIRKQTIDTLMRQRGKMKIYRLEELCHAIGAHLVIGIYTKNGTGELFTTESHPDSPSYVLTEKDKEVRAMRRAKTLAVEHRSAIVAGEKYGIEDLAEARRKRMQVAIEKHMEKARERRESRESGEREDSEE